MAGKVGLGVAVDYALRLGLDAIAARIQYVAQTLRDRLSQMEGVTVQDQGVNLCDIVTVTVEGRQPAELKRELRARGVNTSVTDRESTRLDMEAYNLKALLRASEHYYSTAAEIEPFANMLAQLFH